MMKRQNFNAKVSRNNGITLIALVITIIVLLILAGVSIAMLTGENGIITQAVAAKEATKNAEKKEKSELADLNDYINNINGGPNEPRLAEGMTAVYWDESNKPITEKDSNFNESDWYEYVAGDNETDTKTSKWANAITEDGSYWVWIPRYEYKILSGEGTNTTGKIEVKFIPASQTTADAGYKIHPAFTDGTENKFKNGEWDKELAGIWVAKFEMSGEDAEGNNIQPGNISELSDSVKLVSKPTVSSWRSITVGNSYTIAYNYDREKESHLMKNSEWGAVAYLTHSQYGRNGHEININNSSSYITGSSGSGTNVGSNVGTTNDYTSAQGVLASSTGNIYGIYDLNGGAWERTAAYIANSYAKSNGYGVSFTCDKDGNLITESTKYATVYPYNSSSDTAANNYTAYKNAGYGYGDAILETSSSGTGSNSWNQDYSYFPYASSPFFARGGYYDGGSSAGVFYFYIHDGSALSSNSFRVVLAGV